MAQQADFLAAATAAADAAAPILRRYFRSNLVADCKADSSPVTRADREAEQVMRAVLRAAFPDHDILGEESGLGGGLGEDAGPARKSDPNRSRYRWLLDPIDGTRAFITGRPSFGTLVALLDGNTPILGLIDQPITGERWIGEAGRPTRFTGGYGRIAPRQDRTLAQCEISATSPQMFSAAETQAWRSLAAQAARISYGGDCYAYGLLTLGQIDIVAEADLKPWDWAALIPIVTGAGGSITGWDGAPLDAAGPGRVLALANPALLGQAIDALRDPAAHPRLKETTA